MAMNMPLHTTLHTIIARSKTDGGEVAGCECSVSFVSYYVHVCLAIYSSLMNVCSVCLSVCFNHFYVYATYTVDGVYAGTYVYVHVYVHTYTCTYV